MDIHEDPPSVCLSVLAFAFVLNSQIRFGFFTGQKLTEANQSSPLALLKGKNDWLSRPAGTSGPFQEQEVLLRRRGTGLLGCFSPRIGCDKHSKFNMFIFSCCVIE